MKTVDEIVNDIISQLKATNRSISAEPGTPERLIIEAVAEQISLGYSDFETLNNQFNFAYMSGSKLDAFLDIFGFARQAPTRATGVATFSRSVDSSGDIPIPRGTNVVAIQTDPLFPSVIFQTTETAAISGTDTTVDITIEATQAGTIGNVAANTISTFAGFQQIPGIVSITNTAPVQGGRDGETDAEVKTRFRNTFFRNVSGTTSSFIALAAAAGAKRINVVGPQSVFNEYIQVPSADDTYQKTSYDTTGANIPGKRTSALSNIPYSKWTYVDGYYLSDGGQNPILYRPGVDFVFNSPAFYEGDAVVGISAITNSSGGPISITCVEPHGFVVGDNVSFTNLAPTTSISNGTFAVATVPNPLSFTLGFNGDNVSISSLGVCYKSGPANLYKPNVTFISYSNVGGADNKIVKTTDPSDPTTLLLEHRYISTASRNEYISQIFNCVDVFIDSDNSTAVTTTETFGPAVPTLQAVNPLLYSYTGNYVRDLDGTTPSDGNYIHIPMMQPVVSLPDTITVGDNVYYQANHWDSINGYQYVDPTGDPNDPPKTANFWLIVDQTNLGGSIRARNAIEFTTGGGIPGDAILDPNGVIVQATGKSIGSFTDTSFLLPYTYDMTVANIQKTSESHKQVTTDVLVHRAKHRNLKLYITVMYDNSASVSDTNAAMYQSVSSLFDSLTFGGVIQMSDLLQVLHNTNGVDNVRWTRDAGLGYTQLAVSTATYSGKLVTITTPTPHGMSVGYTVSVAGVTTSTQINGTWVVASVPGPKTISFNVATTPTGTPGVGSATVTTYQPTTHRVEEVYPSGTSFNNPVYHDDDFFLNDNEIPRLPVLTSSSDVSPALVISRRTQNTWSR